MVSAGLAGGFEAGWLEGEGEGAGLGVGAAAPGADLLRLIDMRGGAAQEAITKFD